MGVLAGSLVCTWILMLAAEGVARLVLWQHTGHKLEAFRAQHFYWSGQVGNYVDGDRDNPYLHKLGYKLIAGPEFHLLRSPGEYRILILGGSAVMGKDTDLDNNFPYVTQQYLERYDTDIKTRVVNGGVSGGLSYQENINLWGLRNYDFDLIVDFTGYNDLYYFFMDPEHHIASAAAFKRRFSLLNRVSERVAEHSVLFARLRYWRMHRHPEPKEVSTSKRPIGSVVITEALLKQFENAYRAQLDTSLRLCQQQHKPLILIAQPFLTDLMRSRPLTAYEQGIYKSYLKDHVAKWQEVVDKAYPVMLAVMRERCDAYNVPFVYMAPRIQQYNGIFRDDVHVHGAGINVMGAQVAELIQQKILDRSISGWLVYMQTRALKIDDTNETILQVYHQEKLQ